MIYQERCSRRSVKKTALFFYAGFIVNSYKTVTGETTLFRVERYLIQ